MFTIATSGGLTLPVIALPNGSAVGAHAVDEVSGAVFELETTADLPAATQFRSHQLFMNNRVTAAGRSLAIVRGIFVETDYRR